MPAEKAARAPGAEIDTGRPQPAARSLSPGLAAAQLVSCRRMTNPTTTISQMRSAVTRSARKVGQSYSGGADRPLRGYLITMSAYGSMVGTLTALAAATGRDIPDGLSRTEVILSAAATHKLSRLLAKDPVTSPLRAPFATYAGQSGPAELAEDVRGEGERKTIGELITCPFCTSVWVATGMTAGLVFLPRVTRLVMGTFAALAGADILQFTHAGLERLVTGDSTG